MTAPLDILWYTRCPVPTGLGIAVQKGWLQDTVGALGTQVQSLRESSDKAVRESHFDHSLRNSVRHGGNIPAIWARAQGRETRVIGLSWADEVQLILTRAEALRGLENALRLEGLQVDDLQLVNFRYEGTFSDPQVRSVNGTPVSTQRVEGRNLELVGLLRGEVDAIFLKGASAARQAHEFGLHTVIDTGSHPEPLIRSNNGTPRTLAVDLNLLDNHFDVASGILDSVLRAEHWAHTHPEETRRYLARETNSSEYWVSAAYGDDVHLRLRTELDEQAIDALQDFTHFLHRWRFIPNSFDVRGWIDRRPLDALQDRTTALAG